MNSLTDTLRIYLLVAAVLLRMPSLSWGADEALTLDQIAVESQRKVLANGLTVLVGEMPNSMTFSVYVLIKTGSAVEGEFLGSGISHFLEHMLFKGTDKFGVGQIPQEVQAMGGTINATTSFDTTFYTLTVPYQQWSRALEIIADMIQNPRMDPPEIEKERNVILNELRMHKDNPDRYLSQLVFENVYQVHPYRLRIIGYEPLLKSLTRDDLIKYFQQRYQPDNMVLSVAGNIDAEEVLAKIEKLYGDMPRRFSYLRQLPQEPPQILAREVTAFYPTSLTRLSMNFQGVSAHHPDMYALDVLANVLGQGESSRFYLELFKEKQIVKSVEAFNYTPQDPGMFGIECVLDPGKIDLAKKKIREMIAQISSAGVSSNELEKARNQVLSAYLHEQRTAADQAYHHAIDEAIMGDYRFSQEYVEAVGRVSTADVQRVAQTYLTERNLTTVILKPEGEADQTEKAAVPDSKSEIEKIRFPNGVTLLLKEDPSLPLVHFCFSLFGGTREEIASLNGLSELTARLWTKGTASRTAEEIAESMESRGASLGGFSGRNSFGIRLTALSSDASFATDLLGDLILNPAFPENELGKEKEKVLTDIVRRDDHIYQNTERILKETLFLTHPLRWEELGTRESVANIQRKDILEFFTRAMVPEHMVVSVFGKFSRKDIVDHLEKALSQIPPRDRDIKAITEQSPDKTRERTLRMDKNQALVMFGFQGADLFSKEREGLQILTALMGSPFNGRIFNKIREEAGQAYALGGDYIPAWDSGMMVFYVLTSPDSVDMVKGLMYRIIADLQEKPVTDQELEDVKRYLKGNFQMSLETSDSLGFMTSLDELYGLGYDYYRGYDSRVDQVNSQDILDFARQYLDIRKAAIIITLPLDTSTGTTGTTADQQGGD